MLSAGLTSCVSEKQYSDSPEGNFEQLWKIMDQKYCFFDYKHIDWDSVHTVYSKYITPDMTEDALFEVLGNMLSTLKDGHVNLYYTGNTARYWSWYEDYPRNFDQTIVDGYLGTDYHVAGGMKYKILPDNIGYVYYGDFSTGVGNGVINDMLSYFAICNGIIIDVRNNGGGLMTNSSTIASHFTNERVLTSYVRHKTGTGHNDFSEPFAIYLDPADGIRWQKKVIVLTNRHCFSATNDFVNSMRWLPNVTILGDKTGGGSGMPFTSELPNGWAVRFSASPYYDAQMNQIEFGIDPDIWVSLTTEDALKGIDTLIEAARKRLSE
jgi:C-terminal processing protease CtpA/Prc